MLSIKRYVLLLTVLFTAVDSQAQNLTGTWEGDMGTDQFLQLNIVQNGDKLCGYTWDYVKDDRRSTCKAVFEGYFDKAQKKLFITGTSFFANSGSHILMKLQFSHKYVNDVEVLYYKPSVSDIFNSLLNNEGFANNIYLRKVSDKPYQVLPRMQDCIDKQTKPKDTVVKVVPKKPVDSIVKVIPPPKTPDTIVKITSPPKPIDTIVKIVPPVVIKKDSLSIPRQLDKRKNKEQSHIEVNVKTLTLKVYDNAIVDGDTVSIFYNGRLLLSHQLLSEKAIEINLKLDENKTRHEITLFAENLGSIPPNTALIVITAGEKRYELFASASLEENAVLVFDYKPKKE